MSGENHSEKLHRNDRDKQSRPDVVSNAQKRGSNDAHKSAHDDAADRDAAKRMAQLADEKRKAALAKKAQGAANELFAAMDGWGTDENKIFATLRGKSAEEIKAIKAAYQAKTKRSLEADLTDELSGNDLKEAKALLSADPVQQKVAALQNAMEGWGTDETKVKQTLASMTDPKLKAKVIAEYEKQTGVKLSNALAAEGMASAGVDPKAFKATPSGPKLDEKKVKELAATKDIKLAAISILAATDRWGTDEKAISAALKGKTPEEIAAIKKDFKEHSGGKDLEAVLEDELSGTALKEAKALLSADPVRAAVAQLHDAASGFGTNTEKIHETLKGITDPEIRRKVTAEYEKETGQKLDDMLESELSGFEKDKAKAYAEGNKAKIAAVEADSAMHGGFLTSIADGMADTLGIDREQVRSAVGGAILGPYATVAAAAGGMKVGTDFGTDNKALFAALEGCKDQKERDELIKAYKDRTGRDLMADVMADLEGKEKDVATYIMAGDKASAEAAKMAAAASGMGTDRKAIFEALEKAENQAERDAIIAKYNELYGKNGQTFEKMIASELDELDRVKAQQLAKTGKMDDGFALYYAMNEGFLGIGTDDELLQERLKGKSKEEIEKLKQEYAEAAKRYGGRTNADLLEDVKGETSGRAGHELRQAMKGNPTTFEEMRQRYAEDYAFERKDGGWFGDAAMFAMNPLGYTAMKASGENPTTNIGNALTDMWSGSGQRLDQTHADIERRYAEIKKDPRFASYDSLPIGSPERAAMDKAMMAELQGTADWQEGDLKAFQEAKDATADLASTAVTVVVGAVVTIASGGTAAPAVVALISGLAGVSTKMIIRGAAMSNEEIVQETAAVIAEAAASGIVSIGKINQFCEKVGALAGGNNKLLANIVQEALEEAIESGSEEIINAALDPELYKGDLADWAKGMSQRTGKAMFTGAYAGGVASSVGALLPNTKTWYGRAGASATSQAVGAVATAAIDPASYEGSQEEKLVRFGRSVSEAALRGARDSLGGGHGDSLGDEHYDASQSTKTDVNNNSSKTSGAPLATTETGPEPLWRPGDVPRDQQTDAVVNASADADNLVDGDERKHAESEKAWTEHEREKSWDQRRRDLRRKFEESQAYEADLRQQEETKKATMDAAWAAYDAQQRQAVELAEMEFAAIGTDPVVESKPQKPIDFPDATPGSIPANVTEAQRVAFEEANKVYASVQGNKILGPDFAKLQWVRVLAEHGITVESGTVDLGTKTKALEASEILDRDGKQPNNLPEFVVAGEPKLAGRSKTQRALSQETVRKVLSELGLTMAGFDVKAVTGDTMVIRLINDEGKPVDYMIRLLPPDTLPEGQIAGAREGDSENESFVWVSRDLTDDQVVRALGGIISQVVAKAGGAAELGMAHAGQIGQLDAMLGHLDALTSPVLSPKPVAGSKIEQAIAASKAESPDRIKAEIDLQLGRMGLFPSHPTFESQLAALPQHVADRVRAYLATRSLNVNSSAILTDASLIIKPEEAAETLPAKSQVLAATPDSKTIKPYTQADLLLVLELRTTFEALAEIDQRLKQRDQKGTNGDEGKIAEGETLRRRELVRQAQQLMGQLQLGGTDMAYYDARLAELEAVFPGLGAQLAPMIKSRVEDRLQSEVAHKRVLEYQKRAAEQAAKIEELLKTAEDPFLGDRLVIGDGPAGLANIATLGIETGEDGFINPMDCLVLGGKDLISKMAEADSTMKWGQRAEVFDPTGDGEAHAIFSDQNGKATGELQQTSEDAGDFATVGAVSDAFDLARQRLGIARVGAKVLKVELRPADLSNWPEKATGHGARVLIEFADGSTKWVYMKHVDVTAGLGSALLPDSSILSNQDKKQLFENKAIVGGEELMTGKNVGGKRVLVLGYGPTGAWAAVQAAKQGALQVDWTGSMGEAGKNESALSGLQGIDRVQEAFEKTSNVNTSADRILAIQAKGEGAIVTYVHGKPPNEQTYTVEYDVIVMAMAPSNTSENVVGNGLANAGTMLEGIEMRAQGIREDGSSAAVLESAESDDDGVVRVLGAAAFGNVQVNDQAEIETLNQRRNDLKKQLSADSPDARVMEATSEISKNANKKSAKSAAKTETESQHTDTSGTASAIENSSFHGKHTDKQAVQSTDVEAQLKRLGYSLASVLSRVGAGTAITIKGTTLEVALPSGEVRIVTVGVADSATDAVATFELDGPTGKILVSPNARLEDLERALAHEVAEIVALWTKTASNENPSNGSSAHDVGRNAELAVLLDQFQTAAQSTGSTNTNFGDRADLVHEVRALLADMGLPSDGNITPEIEQRLGPIMTAQLRKLFFLSSPEFKSVETGTSGGIVVHGTDTKIGESGKPGNFQDGGTPGHIMATDMRVVEHDGYRYDPLTNEVTDAQGNPVDISALPAETRDALLAKVQHVSFGVTSLQLVNNNGNKGTAKVGTGELSPVRGMAPFTQTAMAGADLGYGQDKYLWGKLEGLQDGELLEQEFKYGFSKAFVQPEGFRIRESMWRQQQQNMAHEKQSYVLATSSVVEGQKVGTENRQVSVHEKSKTVQARNCATSIVEVFKGLKTVGFDGFPAEKVLDATDFAMLGMNDDGSYQPGRDLRPQDVYEHLRWKEADWRRRLGEAMMKNSKLASEVLAKLGQEEFDAIKRAAGG
ncbi:MAG: annexin [Kofleriaceae bacterium]|nr:annexin [Kofleriaceae bacterium]